jgi:hypothetical protein
MEQSPTTGAGKPSSGSRLNRQFGGFEGLPTKGTTERHVTSLGVTASILIFPTFEFTHPIRLPQLPHIVVRPILAEGRTGRGRWTAKNRPEAGGTKTGLALGEWGGGDDARTFFDRDDLIGWDIGGVIDLAAGPADFDGVGFSAIAETEGED